jgi:ribosomal protein S18 acetylase RimI-like enzyme
MKTVSSVILRELPRAELGEAARLVGRGMRDNPSDVRIFRMPDAERRSQAMARFFMPVLHGLFRRGLILGAFRDNGLVGVCGMARPGLCQPTPLEKLRVLPSVVSGNPVWTSLRVLTYVREWARHDPSEPHWHLGPVAVEPVLQGQGIGSAMLGDFSTRMDDGCALSYLETDKSENVLFYQRFGFTVVAEAEVLGVPNWFMSRPARAMREGGRFQDGISRARPQTVKSS